ncbi:uncharacterized mitochondrial protein AtMg00810-like [Carya illinoinensis]|uniref:uncharacterized mitochondrial protein AtMg00810-like n=1 Tax=Carya illinoinensis TaxID=32201 RepID=UPI001C720166|nr:uncharacterized mitochondrial protein AtMg00810-like [Carya illinoinensis]
MNQPFGYIDLRFPHHVRVLQRALYGLNQAPCALFQRFSTFFIKFGFVPSRADSSLFVCHTFAGTSYLVIYVDDIVVTCNNSQLVTNFLTRLSNEFAMKDLGALHYFLCIEVQSTSSGLFLSQTKYAVATPMVFGQKLTQAGSLFFNSTLYRSIVGALQYLVITRPELAYSVNTICQHMHSPSDEHFRAVKCILRYVKGTLHFGLNLYSHLSWQLLAYSDADWVSCPDTRHSTSGYAIYLGQNLVSWSAKKQPTVSSSSAESEYRSLALAATEVTWLTHLLHDLHISLSANPTIFCDN